jgi:hypothetical protein
MKAFARMASGMKRTRHKRTPSVRRRALEIIAAHPGCTEALLAGESIPADLLIELMRGGLVMARSERIDEEDGAIEVTRVWITEAGERVLAART